MAPGALNSTTARSNRGRVATLFRELFWTNGEPWRTIRSWLTPQLLRILHSLLMCTLRITSSGVGDCWPAPGEGTLLVTWHDETLTLLHFFRFKNISAMMSTSRAGRVQAAFWRMYGFRTVWGSTNKREGIRALRETRTGLQQGHIFAFTPDGPKGPRHKAQPGVVYLASKAKVKVIFISMAAERAWHLPTWDRFVVPKPFSRVHVHVGPVTEIPPDLTKEQTAAWQERIGQLMEESGRIAAQALVAA